MNISPRPATSSIAGTSAAAAHAGDPQRRTGSSKSATGSPTASIDGDTTTPPAIGAGTAAGDREGDGRTPPDVFERSDGSPGTDRGASDADSSTPSTTMAPGRLDLQA